MLKKFSINDLVLATNSILASNSKKKIQIGELPNPEPKRIIVEKKIEFKKEKNYLANTNSNLTNKLKNDVNSLMVNELYNQFKKKIKKNTLKIIVDQRIETEELIKKINFLTTNINNLENHNKNFKVNLDKFSKDQELLESDNQILNAKFVQTSQEKNILEINNSDFKNNLYIQNKNSQLFKKENLILKNRVEEINKDKALLEENLNTLYPKLNKIIKEKNFLQLNNKDLKEILITSTENNKLLLSNSKYLQENLYKIVKNKKLLHDFNNDLQVNLAKLQNNNKLMEETNVKIQNNLNITKLELEKSLKNNNILEIRNKELSQKIKKTNHSSSKEITNKIKFYQDENVRLSSELVLTQERFNILKTNIIKSEEEKDKISLQIQELNNSFNNSLNNKNIVKTSFYNEDPQPAEDNIKRIKNK
tara:strand:- start:499 stop:1761 length:1263 start_codon:yes stop_codon:yes gene_type:complete